MDTVERINKLLERSRKSPFVTVYSTIQEAKLSGDMKLAEEIQDAAEDCGLGLESRTSSLIKELETEEEEE